MRNSGAKVVISQVAVSACVQEEGLRNLNERLGSTLQLSPPRTSICFVSRQREDKCVEAVSGFLFDHKRLLIRSTLVAFFVLDFVSVFSGG